MQKWNLIIFMPAYNSADSLTELLDRINKLEKKIQTELLLQQVIVIDDGSQDKTDSLLKLFKKNTKYLYYLTKNKNQGATAAIFDALALVNKILLEKKQNLQKTLIVRMDSDLEHQPEDIEKLISPLISGKSKISVGYIPFDLRNGLLPVIFNRYFGSIESSRFLGVKIPQFCPGFYCIRADLFLKLYPTLLQLRTKFEKIYNRQMLILDFVTLKIAKDLGENLFVIKLMPIEDKWIKKVPLSKISTYLGYHKTLMDFLKII